MWNMMAGNRGERGASVSFCLGVTRPAVGGVGMVEINRAPPPLLGLMGQLMLAGCYDNVSRIIIYSTTPPSTSHQ